MGAWGTGPFWNDGAQDWLAELEHEGASAVERAFADFQDAQKEGYVEVDFGQMAIAAAEVVAAANGQPFSVPDTDTGALDANLLNAAMDAAGGELDGRGDLLALALDIVGAIEGASRERMEIVDLWADASPEDNQAFRASLADLVSRLEKAAK